MHFSICGQNNRTRCTRGIKKFSDLFLPGTMSGKRQDKERRAGLFSCVWIPANCLDEETLMSHITPCFSVAPSLRFYLLFSLATYLILPRFSFFHCLTSLFSSFSLPSFIFCAICLPRLPRLPFSPAGLGSVASNAFHSA